MCTVGISPFLCSLECSLICLCLEPECNVSHHQKANFVSQITAPKCQEDELQVLSLSSSPLTPISGSKATNVYLQAHLSMVCCKAPPTLTLQVHSSLLIKLPY